MTKKFLIQTMEKFYICSQLPIMALHSNTNTFGSFGHKAYHNKLFIEANILQKALNHDFSTNEKNYHMISCQNQYHFTICKTQASSAINCLYVLGPHSCIQNNLQDIPYKPKCLLPSLIYLLDFLERDISCCKNSPCYHSYHIKKAINYINAKYDQALTLNDVAAYLNINKSYFCTLLKKETGKTFTNILNETRIEKSKHLLLKEHASILDVALASGFNNQNYYNITFKKISGMTPLEYKKRHNGN